MCPDRSPNAAESDAWLHQASAPSSTVSSPRGLLTGTAPVSDLSRPARVTWELAARSSAAIRATDGVDAFHHELLIQLLRVTDLGRAIAFPCAAGSTTPPPPHSHGEFDTADVACIESAVRGYVTTYGSSSYVEWIDRPHHHPAFAGVSAECLPRAAALISIGAADAPGWTVVYADSTEAAGRPDDSVIRALEFLAGDVADTLRRHCRAGSGVSRESFRAQIEASERDILSRALADSAWNVSGAARQLHISRQHLHNLVRKHALSRR